MAEFSITMLKQRAELDRNVQLNAIYNSKRKRGQKFLELFDKKSAKKKKEMSAEEIKHQRALIFET